MQEVIRYGKLSNFKINLAKSVLLPSYVPPLLTKSLQNKYPVKWNKRSLPYLGVQISEDMKLLYEQNYSPILAKIVDDLRSWKGHTLTMFGRINTLKMNIVPRLLYVLYTVPIPLPQIFFKKVRRAFLSFIWKDGNARLAYNILHRSKKEGGVGMPHIATYYKAISLVRILTLS